MQDISIYIHIPFCDHKCIYCDFYSIITEDNKVGFINSIGKEIANHSELLSEKRITSIFFGGGTPSLLEPSQLNSIMELFQLHSRIDSKTEITLETNPGTVDLEKLKEFRNLGFNRISIGVQSFDDNDLKFLTRIHDKRTAINTIENAKLAGFSNINIDLIFSIPKQSQKIWKENLELAVSLPVQHISAYSLILERGTILNKMVLDGEIKLKDEDFDANLYEFTLKYLSAKGFEQYEVSNFSKSGFECQHNLTYWGHKNYLGFGPSAHSFLEGKRWWNYSSLKMYMEAVNAHGNAIRGTETLGKKELQQEYIMLALRSQGLDLEKFNELFGNGWINKNEKKLSNLINEGYIIRSDNFIKFATSGYLLCDEILQNFD